MHQMMETKAGSSETSAALVTVNSYIFLDKKCLWYTVALNCANIARGVRLLNVANKQPRYKAAYKITTYQVEILNRMKDKLLKVGLLFWIWKC